MEPSTNNSSPAIPIAIIFGFAMIAIAIFLTNKSNNDTVPVAVTQTSEERDASTDNSLRTVDKTDYIKGNPNAPILIIEYSDYECPFCKEYHQTMNRIMDEFGVGGKVAWVYRQFPLAQLHPNAPKISEAALCVGESGGNDAFWKFSDKVFEQRDFNAPTNVTLLPQYATEAGVDRADYIRCLNSGHNRDKVLASAEEAFEIGARGTPYTVVMVGTQQAVINGAQPYSVVKGIIEGLIGQLEGTSNPETTITEPQTEI